MTFLKQFLKPNWWKAGMLILFLLPFVFVFLNWFGLRGFIRELPILGTFLGRVAVFPLRLNVIFIEFLEPVVYESPRFAKILAYILTRWLDAWFTSILVYYLLSCFVYFIFSKIFKRKSSGE